MLHYFDTMELKARHWRETNRRSASFFFRTFLLRYFNTLSFGSQVCRSDFTLILITI